MSSRRFLTGRALAPTSRAAYRRAVLDFIKYAEENGESPQTADELDELLADYLDFCFFAGRSKAQGHCLLNGIVHLLPRLKYRLGIARLAMRGWEREQPSVPHQPITWEALAAMAVTLASWRLPAEGLACLLMFRSLLRISEVCALRISDVVFPGDARVGSAFPKNIVGLRLRTTKTGNEKFAQLDDSAVIALLKVYVGRRRRQGAGEGSFLFGFLPGGLRTAFKAAAHSLGLVGYTPHSCRHGGATDLFLRTEDIELVLIRGRWASTKSARHYVQSGRSLLLAKTVPERAKQLGVRCVAGLRATFEAAAAAAASTRRG
jgi:integrase